MIIRMTTMLILMSTTAIDRSAAGAGTDADYDTVVFVFAAAAASADRNIGVVAVVASDDALTVHAISFAMIAVACDSRNTAFAE